MLIGPGTVGTFGAMSDLEQLLHSIDGAGYGAYKRLRGSYDLGGGLRLHVDRVQSDPFAPPSMIQVEIPIAEADLPPALLDAAGQVAAGDFIARRVQRAIGAQGARGGKEQGSLGIDAPGQQVLPRAAVVWRDDALFLRMDAALPARGRRIRGRAAAALLVETLPDVIEEAVFGFELPALEEAVELYRDQLALRSELADRGLVSFVADGSMLPRESGDSDRPLAHAVPFESPASMRQEFRLPSGNVVRGMGIPAGVTLIVGGGYHGKSTLLRALERGVYNHVAGDGREFAITVADAAALRAEDGRSVTGVDISQFISGLPSGADTREFSTSNASGSTSQAAGLIEALEAEASCLLIDEDTSATNFMIRDDRMRRLVPEDKEPITPLIDRVRALYRDLKVSTVLVAGGSGAFIDVVDTVIMLDRYHPLDITERARGLAEPLATEPPEFPAPSPRVVAEDGVSARSRRRGRPKPPQAKGLGSIRHGDDVIDLHALEQLVDASQTSAIAVVLARLESRVDGVTPLVGLVAELLEEADRVGIDSLSTHGGRGAHPGRLAMPRRQEVMAAVNRFRGLRIQQSAHDGAPSADA